MLTIDPKEVSTGKVHHYLLGAVGPRPICFASTMDLEGNANLSPFSFFNCFSANPPILVFSVARRVRDNTTKHTLHNVRETGEVVVNIVNYSIVQQMSLASTEYPDGVDEFLKAGLTKVKSDLVKPFRVKESPVQLECKVKEVMAMGDEAGAGNLIICEVVKMHISRDVLDDEGAIDQHKIDQVARMGGNWYTRANQGMFEVPKPLHNLGMGVDKIPDEIRLSTILTGNDLGKLGNVEQLPEEGMIKEFMRERWEELDMVATGDRQRIHRRAQEYLHEDRVDEAWKLLLAK
ncbi:MAG: flavin reductase [Cytophagaceae bacterium]|nr:flavin reductase [Cytophagaceae bacterium]|tara:strand:- start:3772 stop:4644 length:873 start_codon:yes stop_codon:yes gene_type:complete